MMSASSSETGRGGEVAFAAVDMVRFGRRRVPVLAPNQQFTGLTTTGQAFRLIAWPSAAEYDFRMHKARVTVTVQRDVLAKAERLVRRGSAKSISAWVNAAMEEKARREDLAALLSEMKAENGPANPEEVAWARAVLGL